LIYREARCLYSLKTYFYSIATAGDYTIKVKQTTIGMDSDPDFILYKSTPFKYIGISEEADIGVEESVINLEEGDYLLDLSDWAITPSHPFRI